MQSFMLLIFIVHLRRRLGSIALTKNTFRLVSNALSMYSSHDQRKVNKKRSRKVKILIVITISSKNKPLLYKNYLALLNFK